MPIFNSKLWVYQRLSHALVAQDHLHPAVSFGGDIGWRASGSREKQQTWWGPLMSSNMAEKSPSRMNTERERDRERCVYIYICIRIYLSLSLHISVYTHTYIYNTHTHIYIYIQCVCVWFYEDFPGLDGPTAGVSDDHKPNIPRSSVKNARSFFILFTSPGCYQVGGIWTSPLLLLHQLGLEARCRAHSVVVACPKTSPQLYAQGFTPHSFHFHMYG